MKLTTEQIEALRELLKTNTSTWKAVLRNLWSHSDRVHTPAETALYQLRNRPDFDLRRMPRAFLSGAIETLSNPHKTVNAPLVDNASAKKAVEIASQPPGAEPAHYFDKPGRFELAPDTGAGIALREAREEGSDLVSVSYKLPIEVLEDCVRLLNEERDARYVVKMTTTIGGINRASLRGQLSCEADERSETERYVFRGPLGARARALACFEQLCDRDPAIADPTSTIDRVISLERNGHLIKERI